MVSLFIYLNTLLRWFRGNYLEIVYGTVRFKFVYWY